MKIGFIGLGRMGYNMVSNLIDHKHTIVAYNRSPDKTKKIAKYGAIPAFDFEALVKKLPKQKIIWLMVPSGKATDDMIDAILPYLKKGDIIIDGGNSFFKESVRRYHKVKKKGIAFLDCGTSGGISGARYGACMMIGGDKPVFKKVEKLFKDMCVKDGYGYMGKTGAGHFVKGMHNGIEYGMMAALAEGMQGIKKHQKHFKTDLETVSKVYAHGSIIASRLASWMWDSYRTKGYLTAISGSVPKGETEEEMKELEKLSYLPILNRSRRLRMESREKPSYAGKIMAALRNQFGGHKVIKGK